MSSETSDGTSTISPLVRDTSDDLIAISQKPNSQFDPFVESELYQSRVYSRAIRRFSTLSLYLQLRALPLGRRAFQPLALGRFRISLL